MGHKPHRPVLSHVEIVTINHNERKVDNTMKQDLGTQFFATNAFETNIFLYSFTFGMQFNLKNSHRIMRFKKTCLGLLMWKVTVQFSFDFTLACFTQGHWYNAGWDVGTTAVVSSVTLFWRNHEGMSGCEHWSISSSLEHPPFHSCFVQRIESQSWDCW